MQTAKVGFRDVAYDGDYGPIRFIRSAAVDVNVFFLGQLDELRFETMGPMPRLLHWDSEKMLTVANDDAAEIRFGMYGFFRNRNPLTWFRGTSFGL